MPPGIQRRLLDAEVHRASVHWSQLSAFEEQIAGIYRRIGDLRATEGPWQVPGRLPELNYLPTADSFRLSALPAHAELLGALDEPIKRRLLAEFDGNAVCVWDLCWVRRQFALANAPPEHAPHHWHQDGSCGHDFVKPEGSEGLVPMITLWAPLNRCGIDSPGLELIQSGLESLQDFRQLTDDSISARYANSGRMIPELDRGDAVLIPGHTVHRTHKTPAMINTRLCVELRFVAGDAVPRRFASSSMTRVTFS